MIAPATLPVIDLADPARAIRDVDVASRESGLFYVSNHGVAPALIAAHFELARSFFALDRAEKMRIDVRGAACFRGYEPFATQTIDASTPGDLKEGFIMGPDLAPDHAHVRARYPNTGANRWPERPAEFRERMETYVAAMNGLGRQLARLLALALDLPGEYFADWLAEPLTYSQLFHYPAVPAEAGLGAGAHVDYGMLTILLQDDVGGLEFRAHDLTWRAAPPVAGTFVIILGELMLRLTDGRYRSALHRVTKNTSGRGRYSMPTFIDPGYDVRVACVPTCLPANGEPQYPPATVAEHMRDMARSTLSARAV